MQKKNLITNFLCPKQGWTNIPTGFLVDGSFNPELVSWDFSPGKPQAHKTVNYTFSNPLTCSVKVTVYDGQGGYDDKECQIVIRDQKNPFCNLDQQSSAFFGSGDAGISIAGDWTTFPDHASIDWGDHSSPLILKTPYEFKKSGWPKPRHKYTAKGIHYGVIKIESTGNSCEKHFVVVIG